MQPSSAIPKTGFNPQDIVFILFKHKWKILISGILGLAAAGVLLKNQQPIYKSEAKLLVRYVLERSTVDTYETESAAGGRTGGGIISAELDILNSTDLATLVAERIGPEKLTSNPGNPSINSAVSAIIGGLTTSTTKESKVIYLSYSNQKPDLAVSVLSELIQVYFEKHLEIHRSTGAFDFVTKQVDQAKSRLKQTEDELNKVKAAGGIMSLPEAVSALEIQRGKAREDVMTTEAQWTEQKAMVEALRNSQDAKPGPLPALDRPAQIDADVQRGLPVAEYKALVDRISFLVQRRMELLARYTATNRLVVSTDEQIAEVQAQRRGLLEKYPELVAVAVTPEKADSSATTPAFNLSSYEATLAALAAKLESLKKRVKFIDQEVERISAIGVQIVSLEHQREIEEQKYRYLESSLDKAKTDEALDPSKMPNISIVQQPSPPTKTMSETTKKIALGLAGGGIAMGLGLAFLFELVLDRRVKRSLEIENRLHLPLLLTIPYIRRANNPKYLPSGSAVGSELVKRGKRSPDINVVGSFIDPYSDAVRDRIIFNFGINNVIHRPKIIGVTSLVDGAGSTTIAVGLARAFSRIKGSKILLVDLASDKSARNLQLERFPQLSIVEALQKSRDLGVKDEMENLVVASASMNGGNEGFAPTHLQQLMPYFERSDYDYVIFDMPKIDRISPTISMAGLLDKILLVLDGDNTNREGLKWGFGQLAKGKADVSCIFNKARSHAPRWVEGENNG
jgi:uncharacterized protein involved in exopolysaccharide biosynthesis/Mrp family chromosome partitioning ATPase